MAQKKNSLEDGKLLVMAARETIRGVLAKKEYVPSDEFKDKFSDFWFIIPTIVLG